MGLTQLTVIPDCSHHFRRLYKLLFYFSSKRALCIPDFLNPNENENTAWNCFGLETHSEKQEKETTSLVTTTAYVESFWWRERKYIYIEMGLNKYVHIHSVKWEKDEVSLKREMKSDFKGNLKLLWGDLYFSSFAVPENKPKAQGPSQAKPGQASPDQSQERESKARPSSQVNGGELVGECCWWWGERLN